MRPRAHTHSLPEIPRQRDTPYTHTHTHAHAHTQGAHNHARTRAHHIYPRSPTHHSGTPTARAHLLSEALAEAPLHRARGGCSSHVSPTLTHSLTHARADTVRATAGRGRGDHAEGSYAHVRGTRGGTEGRRGHGLTPRAADRSIDRAASSRRKIPAVTWMYE